MQKNVIVVKYILSNKCICTLVVVKTQAIQFAWI